MGKRIYAVRLGSLVEVVVTSYGFDSRFIVVYQHLTLHWNMVLQSNWEWAQKNNLSGLYRFKLREFLPLGK